VGEEPENAVAHVGFGPGGAVEPNIVTGAAPVSRQ